jgi:hypothetical protein
MWTASPRVWWVLFLGLGLLELVGVALVSVWVGVRYRTSWLLREGLVWGAVRSGVGVSGVWVRVVA